MGLGVKSKESIAGLFLNLFKKEIDNTILFLLLVEYYLMAE